MTSGQIWPVGCSLLTPGLYHNTSKNLEFKTVPVKPRTSDRVDSHCNSQGRRQQNLSPTVSNSVPTVWGLGLGACLPTGSAEYSGVGGLGGSTRQESPVSRSSMFLASSRSLAGAAELARIQKFFKITERHVVGPRLPSVPASCLQGSGPFDTPSTNSPQPERWQERKVILPPQLCNQ